MTQERSLRFVIRHSSFGIRHSTRHPAGHARRPGCMPAAAPDTPAAPGRDSLRAGRACVSSLIGLCFSGPRRRPRLRSASSSSRRPIRRLDRSAAPLALRSCQRDDKPPQVVLRPTQLLQQLVVDLLFLELVGQLVEHQVGLLAGILQVGRVAFGSGAFAGRRGAVRASLTAIAGGRAAALVRVRCFALFSIRALARASRLAGSSVALLRASRGVLGSRPATFLLPSPCLCSAPPGFAPSPSRCLLPRPVVSPPD